MRCGYNGSGRAIGIRLLLTRPTSRGSAAVVAEQDHTQIGDREGLSEQGRTKATRQENVQNYQPYYAVGDFNRDGQEDFAVALINQEKRSRRFAIAIFNGPFNPRNPRRASVPAFFTERIDLSDGGLVVLSGNRLVAGVFQTDNCVVLRPSGRTYVMKNCL
jgi:hypothetical protein